MRYSFALAAAAVLLLNASACTEEAANTNLSGSPECRCDDGFDWTSRGPLDLLEHLKKATDLTMFSVCWPHPGWVRREHIPALVDLLDSEVPCASVGLMVSSIITGRSTIGNESAYLIRGYQLGRYPPELNSNPTLSPADKEEIRAWWDAEREPR